MYLSDLDRIQSLYKTAEIKININNPKAICRIT